MTRSQFLAHNADIDRARVDYQRTPSEFTKPAYCLLCCDYRRAGLALCTWCAEAVRTRLMVATSVDECAELIALLEPIEVAA